jgi:hypothetical protein
MSKRYQLNPEPQLRQLTSDEIEAVSGGIISYDHEVHSPLGTFAFDKDGNWQAYKGPASGGKVVIID